MLDSLNEKYEYHHSIHRKNGFSIMKKERGELLKNIIGTNKKILDIGCRDGSLTKYFFEGNDVLGVDIDGNMLAVAKNNLGIKTILLDLNGDWEELQNKKFDVVFAGEVIEHLYYPDLVIKKIFDHLEDGGIFLGSVPNAFSLINRMRYLFGNKKNTPLDDPTHINHFNYIEIKDKLKKYFSDVKIIGLGRFSKLAKLMPAWFAFNLFFTAKK